MRSPSSAVAVSGLHLIAGAALTARPATIVDRLAGSDEHAAPSWVARILGARMFVQGLVEAARPHPDLLLAGALVDATHAASMVPAAARWREYRRAAVVSGLGALGCAALAASAAARLRREGLQ